MRMEEAAAPFVLRVEHPLDAGSRGGQIEQLGLLREHLRAAGSDVRLVADEWANTVQDIREFNRAGAAHVIGVVPTETEAALLRETGAGLVDAIVIADARDPVGLAQKVEKAGGPADVTVVCVDAAGCEGGAILSTKQGGTVIFFSMATSFSAAALGAEGLAADVTMLVGNGYVPGHAEFALDLLRTTGSVRSLFERRVES